MSSAVRFRSRSSPSHSGASRPRIVFLLVSHNAQSTQWPIPAARATLRRYATPPASGRSRAKSRAMRLAPPVGGSLTPTGGAPRRGPPRVRGRRGHVHVLQGGAQQFGDHCSRIPAVIGRYEVPRCGGRAGFLEHLLPCGHILIPAVAGLEIGDVEFPELGGIVQSPEEVFFCSSGLPRGRS